MKLLIEELNPNLLQGGTRCQQLGDNVRAFSLFCYHELQAADLPFDPFQSIQQLLVFRQVPFGFDGSSSHQSLDKAGYL